MKRLIAVTVIIGLAVFGLIFTNYRSSSPIKNKDTKAKKISAHTMPKKDQTKLLADLKNDFKIIQDVTDDPKPLSKAMDRQALSMTTKTIKELLAKGLVRVRNYDDMKFSISGYIKGVAQVSFEFTDRSYEYSLKTKKFVTQPQNVKKKLALAVEKKDGTWKITRILRPFTKTKK